MECSNGFQGVDFRYLVQLGCDSDEFLENFVFLMDADVIFESKASN